jgi:hypothetical protein
MTVYRVLSLHGTHKKMFSYIWEAPTILSMASVYRISVLFLFIFGCLLGHAQRIDQLLPVQRIVSGEVAPGYIFLSPTTLDSVNTYPTSLLILDEVGRPVFFKPFSKQQAGPFAPERISDFKLQPSGLLSYSSPLTVGGQGMYLLDSNLAIVDSIRSSSSWVTDAHDFLHFPNGSYHLVGNEERIMDLSGLQTKSGDPGAKNAKVYGQVLERFNSQKQLEFDWKSLDYFALSDVYTHFFTDSTQLDHSHYNALEIDTDGNYLLSFRHLHEITKVDSSTGQLIWRFGGKNNQFTFLGDTMPFSAQHHVQRIANGNLTLFDNGDYNSTPVARGIEYQMDELAKTATVVWQFPEPGGYSSKFTGSTQRLANGNTLIDWGGALPLAQTTSFTEVDQNGKIVLELDIIPNRYISYRALKYKLPFELRRPEIQCDSVGKTLSAPTGYSNYDWNTGATTRQIVVKDTGTYQVWVNQGIGFISSLEFRVDELDKLCNVTGIAEQLAYQLRPVS